MAGILDGKIALVTGGGQGIGRGIVRCFVQEGACVVIAEIDEVCGANVEAETVALGGSAKFIKTDVSCKSDVEAAVKATVDMFGRIDTLVNNAVKLPTPLIMEKKTDELLAEQLAVGVWGSWWAMQAAMPYMRDQGGGRIINFSSMDVDTGAWLHSDYSVAKGGIAAMTRSAAIDWARYNINVNNLVPVAASAAFERMCDDRPGLREQAGKAVPLGRMGDPEFDIAPVAAFLASDASQFITGASLPVDGGLHMPRGNSTPADLSAFGG